MAHWSVPPYHVLFSLHLGLNFICPLALTSFHPVSFEHFFYLPIGLYLSSVISQLSFFCFTCPSVCTTFVLISSGFDLLSHWTVPPFLLSLCCLWFYYITSFIIVNTFFQKNLIFFISFVLYGLFLNFQKILIIYLSFYPLCSCHVCIDKGCRR